ncbi:MAG: bifunctional proline dehydrogenase/L-glutamate gamma-semialdehyde dehydrogenase PutA [Cohaesibacteraceae bacterium]|nr:bifunctional proline dehydrogenase/L-glutamate gamma-semialdehyde dehydrogenase PutA [Cohaesibacteraceae bacterium]
MNSCNKLDEIRETIREFYLANETENVKSLVTGASLDKETRDRISHNAVTLINRVRTSTSPGMMESFLAEYGLSTQEGVALMCLAEALLRVPDAETIDALIMDKISPSEWGKHLGHSTSSLVNASTWALLLTGKVIAPTDNPESLVSSLRTLIKRLGEPVIRTAVAQAMKELGRQFVLGTTIHEATKRALIQEKAGYTYSYDMLGEAARTEADARKYHLSYSNAITALAPACTNADIRKNPGISIKLSALHPRYEFAKRERILTELVSRAASLALLAQSANMGFNIDAEEADRLDLSLDVIEAILSNPALSGWDGFGIVVQAFGHRASHIIDWLHELATRLDRKIMIRLVKGAYWDTEIKRAQVLGLDGYPVFTRKVNSDASYIACSKRLFTMTDRIYPQFATHNAHTVAAVTELALQNNISNDAFEFQRLHGMGEALHDTVLKSQNTACRIYAPVGAHQDLLAYLVRRLLENGANSSFVNQIVDETISPETIAKDPFNDIESLGENIRNSNLPLPKEIFGTDRINSKGWDVTDVATINILNEKRTRYKDHKWFSGPMIAGDISASVKKTVFNPANPCDQIGTVITPNGVDVQTALGAAKTGFEQWSSISVQKRTDCLQNIAELFETNTGELIAITCREAGKTIADAVGEIREAVDFIRYYANEAQCLGKNDEFSPRGVIACISPWNFPLAIFSGQIVAALAAGNAVISKPAGQTPLIAAFAVSLMHQAGIPRAALQLLPGDGATVGTPLTKDPRIAGVCFTGSTPTAQRINRVMAKGLAPTAPFIAETGGLNAMIVDSTALPEQAVRDIIASAFQSAGQRCSALRMLYIQEDVADKIIEMLKGAMDELTLGDPWYLDTDIGPVIDAASQIKINQHCIKMKDKGRLLKILDVPDGGIFCAPALIKLEGIEELEEEIFGPVLHVATFKSSELDQIVDTINEQNFGLTFGLHTRIDSRVQQIVERAEVGNIYVNRNQIGAVVGSQPFGGEGLSGTGPKAGGPLYLKRFNAQKTGHESIAVSSNVNADSLQNSLDNLHKLTEKQNRWKTRTDRIAVLRATGFEMLPQIISFDMITKNLPGPTGETNRLSRVARGVILCLGPTARSAKIQATTALSTGNSVIVISPEAEQIKSDLETSGAVIEAIDGLLSPEALENVGAFDAIASNACVEELREMKIALSKRSGPLIPVITEECAPERFILERHLCVDTTAAGGNATLLSMSE